MRVVAALGASVKTPNMGGAKVPDDVIPALVITGNLRNLKSAVPSPSGRATFFQVPVFLGSDCFRPVCEAEGPRWPAPPSFLPSFFIRRHKGLCAPTLCPACF